MFFFISIMVASSNSLGGLSGYENSSSLHININKSCISRFSRNSLTGVGPYEIKINVFRSVFNKDKNEISKTKSYPVTLSKKLKFDDFKFKDTSKKSVLQDVQNRMGAADNLEYNFDNFEFDIPFLDINHAIAKIPNVTEISFLQMITTRKDRRDEIFLILGIEILVIDQKTRITISRTKVAFPKPDKYTADSLIDDLQNDDAKIFKIWPDIAVLLSENREFFSRSNKHVSSASPKCGNDNDLNFKLSIVKPPIQPIIDNAQPLSKQ